MIRRSLFALAITCLLFGIWRIPALAESKGQTPARELKQRRADTGLKQIHRVSVRNDTSRPLRDLKPVPRTRPADIRVMDNDVLPKAKSSAAARKALDPVTDRGPSVVQTPSTFVNFEGVDNVDGVLPPDTNGDVGPNHYVQMVNLSYQVFDKDGNSLLGPITTNLIWNGFGGDCENYNWGDPIVLYDHLADRWLMSQFALFGDDGNHHQCIAISQTPDPTGAFHRYDFIASTTMLNDYPHFGVWPDGYYMTVNQFDEDTFAWGGAGVFAFERDKMLLGQPAQMVYFDLFGVNSSFGGMLPSDLDGPPPPAGAPNIFMEADDDSVFGTDRLSLWEFHVDWTTPANSTFGVSGNPNMHLDTAAFDWDLCGFDRDCIPQPGTGQGLDAISDRLMFRVQYRNFGAYQTLVANHTVDVDGNDHAGIRWYELRDDGSGWDIFQQGTWAPDNDHRWMGSIAMDSAGNIALGYSVSSNSTFPSIRYAGRLLSDTPGDMGQGETTLIAGSGSQTHSAARWGDYSNMAVDYTAGSAGGIDCDFWYTTEYYTSTSSANWQTRVGAFTFAPGACGGPHGDIQGTVTDAATTDPIAGATVNVGGFTTTTDANGFYHFILGVGNYDVTVTRYGYFSETANNIPITDGGITIQDFALDVAPIVTVAGTVKDGSGHGWPLYARIDIDGYPGDPVFTDPVTGGYSVQLVQDTNFIFNVSAIVPGYVAESRAVTPPAGGSTENFDLTIDAQACTAPGYKGQTWTNVWRKDDTYPGPAHESVDISTLAAGESEVMLRFRYYNADFEFWWQVDNVTVPGLSESFSGGGLPAGWSVVTNGADTDVAWTFDDPCDRTNLTGGTGGFAIADSDCLDQGSGTEDTELRSPMLDMTGQAVVNLEFDTDFNYYGGGLPELADVDVGIGGACAPVPGGLITGHVYDDNTGDPVNGATVSSDSNPSDTTTSFATPDDPNVDDGIYFLFSALVGTNDFTASKTSYGSDTQTVDVITDTIVEQDFHMAAGQLSATPGTLEATVDLNSSDVLTLTLNNIGGVDADFKLQEGNGNTAAPVIAAARLRGEFRPWSHHAERQREMKEEKREEEGPARHAKLPEDAPWTGIDNYPSDIMDNTCAEIDGKIYCVGGFDGGSNVSSGEVYDASLDSWAPIASMSNEREKPAVAAIGGLLYVVGGWDNNGDTVGALEIYDPSGNSWSTGASIPNAYAGSTAVNLDGMLYIIGGCDSGSCGFTDVQVYDPSLDSWSSVAAYPEDTSWNACGVIGGMIYCAGGVSDSNGESAHTYVYDPSGNSWTPLADMPQTQWAMGYIASDDLLYVSGGVTDNFNTVTNEGFAYDPGADSWTPIANSNNVVYRGGSACGFYKIGGSVGGFSPVSDSEVHPGLSNCGGAVDVPWLSEDPVEGTVAAAGSQDIDVTFDTTTLTQPGDYFAHLRIKENTPYSVPDVQVILHVPVPPGWGTLNGTVNGLTQCDLASNPLNKATVFVDTAGIDYTMQTDASGHYQVSFLATDSPATVTVSANGYITQIRSGVLITDGGTTTEDFELRLDAPCGLDVVPTSFEVSLNSGASTTLPLTLNNTGAGTLTFTLFETELPLQPLKPSTVRYPRIPAAPVGAASVRSIGRSPSGSAPAPLLGTWFFGSPVPGGAVRYAHARCDTQPDSFYVFSGVDGAFEISDRAWRYDAPSNTWTELAPMPEGQEGPVATCYAGKIFVMGGGGSNQHYIYDIGKNEWSTGASLPRGVWGASAGSWGGNVYLVGGDDDFDFGGTSNEVNIYNVGADTWTGTATSMDTATVAAGFFQAGPNLYVVGGWDDNFPDNVAASQRYDLSSDTWTSGPALDVPRGDLALAMTDTALYAIGGDDDGGGPFDGTNTVERLEWAGWPGGAWTDLGDPLPVAITANNGGFCTEAIHVFGSVGEFWTVGGFDGFGINGNNAFRPNEEHCYSVFSDVEWLSESPASGSVPADSASVVDVTFNAAGLAAGDYTATLVLTTNDSGSPQINIPVTLHVLPCLFCDEFEDDTLATDWTYKQTWTESGDVLATASTKKASAIATPVFSGCQTCSLETAVSTVGGDSRVWLYGWYVDNNNKIELIVKEAQDKVVLKQRVNGSVIKKQGAPATIVPNTFHQVRVSFDGTNFTVEIDSTGVLTMTPVGTVPSGTVGFGAKLPASFENVSVN